jgi:hypothetical protein
MWIIVTINANIFIIVKQTNNFRSIYEYRFLWWTGKIPSIYWHYYFHDQILGPAVQKHSSCHHDPLLREAYEENLLMYGNNEPCWLRCIHILLKHLNMDHMLTHPENFKSSHIYSIKFYSYNWNIYGSQQE